ncbi:MAG: hypothetical protein Q9166_002985 [cf. Caloplaca sp. 2 TL-2023]
MGIYFWTTIRKNRSKYNLIRGISEDDVTKILLHQVVVDKDVPTAETSLLQLPGLRKFHSSLKSDRERDDFQRHMRKYINIWLPDCPFEVSTTNRYTIVTQEAAVTARRDIQRGETVKYLVGNLVPMTPDEEKDLGLTRRDFSIVMSSRKKTPSIFLGPARFANHDCKANARLVTSGSEGMQIVAAQDIGIGDEITVTYGDNYFGEGNCECLCLTCEKAGRGAWAGPATSGCATPLSSDEDEALGSYTLRKAIRKRSRLSEMSETQSPALDEIHLHKRRKTKGSVNQLILADEPPRGRKKRARVDVESPSIDREVSEDVSRRRLKANTSTLLSPRTSKNTKSKVPGSLKVEYISPAASPVLLPGLHDKKQLPPPKTSFSASPMADAIFDELSAALRKKPLKAKADTASKSSAGSEKRAESITDDNKLELVPPTPGGTGDPSMRGENRPTETPISSSGHDSVFGDSKPQFSSPGTTPSVDLPGVNIKAASVKYGGSSNSDLSELDSKLELDDTSKTIIEKSPKPKRAPRGSKILPTIEVEDASIRIPGDYTRTPLLLGEKYSRWVDCQTCSGCWVQQNGYQTRKECPRCERHSKLYGYQWPKTDKYGRDDEQERVMDHRTVHRFINFAEERLSVKKGKGVNRAGSDSASRTHSVPAEVDKGPVSRLRGSRGSRKGSLLKSGD